MKISVIVNKLISVQLLIYDKIILLFLISNIDSRNHTNIVDIYTYFK